MKGFVGTELPLKDGKVVGVGFKQDGFPEWASRSASKPAGKIAVIRANIKERGPGVKVIRVALNLALQPILEAAANIRSECFGGGIHVK